MKLLTMLPITVAGCLATAALTSAHGSAGRSGDVVGERLARLFEKTGGFLATAQTTIESAKDITVMETAYTMRDGRLRTEMNLGKLKVTPKKGKPKRGAADDADAADMAEMGLDQQVSLVVPENNVVYLIYPKLKAYIEVATPAAKRTGAAGSEPQWKEIGRETVAGHPCVKYLVTTTGPDGKVEELTAWKATDLKDFIIQTQMVADGDLVTTTFRDIRLEKPPAALFEVPAGYRKYGSMQELMMGAMQQMMQPMRD